MSDPSEMLGGWEGDPDELYHQEALLARNSNHSQDHRQTERQDGSYVTGLQQSLVPLSGSRGVESDLTTTVSTVSNRFPTRQTGYGMRGSPFQRRVPSMFSQRGGGHQNIFSSMIILFLGGVGDPGTCVSPGMVPGMSQTMQTGHQNEGPVITEIPTSPEIERKFLAASTTDSEAKANSTKHSNKIQSLKKCEPKGNIHSDKDNKIVDSNVLESFQYGGDESLENEHTCTTNITKCKMSTCSINAKDNEAPFPADKLITEVTTTEDTANQNKLYEFNAVVPQEIGNEIVANPKPNHDNEMTESGCELNDKTLHQGHYQEKVENTVFLKNETNLRITSSLPHSNYCGSARTGTERKGRILSERHVRRTSNKLAVTLNLEQLHASSIQLKKAKETVEQVTTNKKHSPTADDEKTALIDDGKQANSQENTTDPEKQSLIVVEKQENLLDSSQASFSPPINEDLITVNETPKDLPAVPDFGKLAAHKPDGAVDISKETSDEGNVRMTKLVTSCRNPELAGSFVESSKDNSYQETSFNQPTSPHTDFHDIPSMENACATRPLLSESGMGEEKNNLYLQMVANLRALVASEGLVVKDLYPDGNCLFAAVVDQLRVRGEFFFTSKTLRTAAVEHLRKFPYQPDGTPLSCFITDASWKYYLVRMEKDGEWGDHLIMSAIASVLRRKLVILGGLSGLSRTVVEPDHAFKEAVRQWMETESNDKHSVSSCRKAKAENESSNVSSGSSDCENGHVERENDGDELESLYLGHLAESHYVSLRRHDWEERLHNILRQKTDEDLLRYGGNKEFSVSGSYNESATANINVDLPTPHLSFLISFIARNSFETSMHTRIPFVGIRDRRHTLMIVDPTALGLTLNPEKVPSFLETPHSHHAETKYEYDILDIPSDSDVIKPGEAGNTFDLILHDEDCFPGYARLEPVEPDKWGRCVEKIGDVTFLKHLRCKNRSGVVGQIHMQRFLAFRSRWPDIAEEWSTRQRPYEWPPKHIRVAVERQGCHFISPGHQSDETLWKYTFAAADKSIITCALSDAMTTCFRVFKALLDSALGESALDMRLLVSVLFHCCEELPTELWNSEPVSCLLKLLQKLKGFLQSKRFPNYFVHSWNILDDVKVLSHVGLFQSKIELLENNLLVSVYFMLDNHNQTSRLRSVLDNIIEDGHRFLEHECWKQSFETCFFPISAREIQNLIILNCYESAFAVIHQVFSQFHGVMGDNQDNMYKLYLTNILSETEVPLTNRWCFTIYLDFINGENISQLLFGSMQTVPLATVFGPELNEKLAERSKKNDILIPRVLTTPFSVLNLLLHITDILLPDLGLEDISCGVVHFFLRNQTDYLIESSNAFIADSREERGLWILSRLHLLYRRIYSQYREENNVDLFIELMEGLNKICELMSIPEDLRRLAKLWRYFGNFQRANDCQAKAEMLEA